MNVRGNSLELKPVDTVAQNNQSAGDTIGNLKFNIAGEGGRQLQFTVSMKEGILQIQPVDEASSRFADKNPSGVIGVAVLEAVQNLNVRAGNIRIILLDLN